jgi:hypothetical protein
MARGKRKSSLSNQGGNQMNTIKPKETQFEEIARQTLAGDDNGGLAATGKRTAAPVKPALKQDAAKKVFQEGVTGKDHGADAAMEKLPHINVPGEKK